MIKTEIITINYTKNDTEIEKQLKALGIIPLRWAIIEIKNTHFVLSVSFESE